MKLIDPSQRIKVLWDNDDGTRYTEEMTIRRLLAVMSDDEVKTVTIREGGKNVIDLDWIKTQLMIIGMGIWALVIVEVMKWLWT